MEGGGHNEEVASSNSSLDYKNRYPIYDQKAEKPYPLGLHIHTYIAHLREYPPPPGPLV